MIFTLIKHDLRTTWPLWLILCTTELAIVFYALIYDPKILSFIVFPPAMLFSFTSIPFIYGINHRSQMAISRSFLLSLPISRTRLFFLNLIRAHIFFLPLQAFALAAISKLPTEEVPQSLYLAQVALTWYILILAGNLARKNSYPFADGYGSLLKKVFLRFIIDVVGECGLMFFLCMLGVSAKSPLNMGAAIVLATALLVFRYKRSEKIWAVR